MIVDLKITGFKSLKNYSLSLEKGLNVLIGPNGSGKTNICQALGLVAAVVEDRISDYLLSIGGAYSSFSLKKLPNSSGHKKTISATYTGIIPERMRIRGIKHPKLKYSYSFKICLDEQLKLTKESLDISVLTKGNRFKAVLSSLSTDKLIEFRVKEQKLIGPVAIKELREGRRRLHKFRARRRPLESIIPFLGSLNYYCRLVRRDIQKSKVFNIDPYVAKKPSDISEPSVLLTNGRRLANTIAEMSKYRTKQLNEIDNFLEKIYPRHGKLQSETLDDNFTRTFSIKEKNGIKCPAQSLSDGVVKTIAVLTAITGEYLRTVAIEEPENYLHPWASQTLVEYLRQCFSNTVCIITTHSETILNCIAPNELIVCSNDKGHTTSTRLKNARAIKDAIKMSGFGAGFHYVSGAFGGTPQ